MRDRSTLPELRSLVVQNPPVLTEQPAAVYLSGLGPGSRRAMQQALDVMARMLTNESADALTLDWAALRYKHTAALRAALTEKYAPATVTIKSIKVTTEIRGRALSQAEVTALLSACLNDPNRLMGARDAALMAILRGGGLRREEAVNLDLKDLNCSTGSVKVRCGKGGKDRTVYLPAGLLALVEDWLNIRGSGKGKILCHIRKGSRVVVRQLTPQSVWVILGKRAQEAGVKSFSPHDFRRTFISNLLDAGVDLVTVQQLAGHSDPSQTARYDRRGEETKRLAVQVLDVPCR